MKIKVFESYGTIKKFDIVDAAVSPNMEYATVYDDNNTSWIFYKHQFELVEEESRPMREILDEIDREEIPKVYGNKYTLSELKELKELLK